MGLIAASKPISVTPPNEPPEWTTDPPVVTFIAGIGGTTDLNDSVFDPEADSLTFVKTAGSWPTGVSLASNGIVTATTAVVEGTTAGITVTADDGTNSPVASSSFSVVISAAQPLAAFPGAEGFGTETSHGRGGVVVQVTNTNDSGAGSLREALRTEGARIIIFRVSGTIDLQSKITMGGEHSDCGVFGQTAPGDGICLAADADHNGVLVQISNLSNTDAVIDECHDVVFQHIRYRHGSEARESPYHVANNDCFDAHAGTYNLVIDHCSFSWASDENITFWHHNNDDDTITDMHDITVSHCIIGEGDNVHNTGHMHSGGAHAGDKFWNMTYHHNLGAHLQFRDVSNNTGSGDSTKGSQFINNVHYDCLAHYGLGQNQYVNNQLFFDCINDCFIRSSRQNSTGSRKFNVNRLYTLTGQYGNGPDPYDQRDLTPVAWDESKVTYSGSPPSAANRNVPDAAQLAGVWHPPSLYVTGSIQREIDLSDTTPSSAAAEADNTDWILYQYKGNSGGGGPYDGGETHEERVVPLATQPTNPVTTTTALQAHTDLIVNGDLGALPHDSVDARIVASVQDGTVYDRYNVPGYPGSTAVWPTLTDTGADTDTSGNGLPDYYQVGVLGKAADDAYNPANTFTLPGGYSDIENWIHTL